MIALTGAAGFIGSCLAEKLNQEGHTQLVLVDDFSQKDKNRNLEQVTCQEKVARTRFLPWFETHAKSVDFVFHLGARTDTTEKDTDIFDELNLDYTKRIWEICAANRIPLVYASSAATYGSGENGYVDSHSVVPDLRPLNPYGRSKNDFDKWALEQPLSQSPPFWAGLKFFNVYGPNEYHKGRMASVVFHTFNQIRETGAMKLFRSHRPDVKNGFQKRDFIYVKDVVDVCYYFHNNRSQSGLYNVGTGEARTFLDLATATFHALGLTPDISFIDIPPDIRETYQYFTEADMKKLRAAGYTAPFYSLEEGVTAYVQEHLKKNEKKIVGKV